MIKIFNLIVNQNIIHKFISFSNYFHNIMEKLFIVVLYSKLNIFLKIYLKNWLQLIYNF